MDAETKAAFRKLAEGFKILHDGILGLIDEDEPEEEEVEEKPKRKRRGPPKRRRKPKAKPEPEEDDEGDDADEEDEPSSEADVIDKLPRVKLIPIARELGINTKAKTVGKLRALIKEAREGGGDEEEEAPKKRPRKKKKPRKRKRKPRVKLEVLQDSLSTVVENHYDDLEEAIEELGCGADCYNCPAPEEDSAEEQVKACLRSVGEALDLEFDDEVQSAL